MFVITKRQFAALGEQSFTDRIRGTLTELFPEQTRQIPPASLDAQILKEVRNAAGYGLVSEQAAATFVMTAWLLGPGFDKKFPAVQEYLTNRRRSESEKAKWLEAFSVCLLQTLQK
ncbi:MAG: hypothetical protein ABSH50_33075 [Bryobacteraceae bacterium]|jgi:hypothetical protein